MGLEERVCSVLTEAYPALHRLQDGYCIIGSAALVLSGVGIAHTADIDIQTSVRGADYLWQEWQTRAVDTPVESNHALFQSHFKRFCFGELEIEILGNLKVKKERGWQKLVVRESITVQRNGMEFTIPTLEELERIFTWFGREKDIEKSVLIKAYREQRGV